VRAGTFVSKLHTRVKRDGLYGTLHVAAFLALNRVTLCKIFRGVWLERVDAKFLEEPAGYLGTFLSDEVLMRFAADPANELSPAFVEAALAKGDRCYGVLHGDTLAAYGWYAHNATPVGLDDLVVRFHPDHVYMYKGFTHEEHRGKRLHAVGMAKAMRHFQDAGYRGLVSYVESVNLASLKSCYRMGYQSFGSVYLLKLGERFLTAASPGCARFGFEVRPGGPTRAPARSSSRRAGAATRA